MTKKEKLAFMRIFGTDFMRRMMDKNDHWNYTTRKMQIL